MITIIAVVVVAFIVFVIYKKTRKVEHKPFKKRTEFKEWKSLIEELKTVMNSNITKEEKDSYLVKNKARFEKFFSDPEFKQLYYDTIK